jgi:hypothetical protein
MRIIINTIDICSHLWGMDKLIWSSRESAGQEVKDRLELLAPAVDDQEIG